MAALLEWKVPAAAQPRAEDHGYDLARVLSSIVGLDLWFRPTPSPPTRSHRACRQRLLIDDDLVLTIGYLITEAETVWLHYGYGRVAPGHALGLDSENGFGLVQALEQPRSAGAAASAPRARSKSASAW